MPKRIFALLLACALALGACAPAASPSPTAAPATEGTPSLRTLRLPMGFIPSVQYAPFYVAVEQGYFAEAGLALEFDYSFETNGVQLVGANELPFAVVSGEQVLLARAQGLPVVYVMAWFQKFPVAVITKADSGIQNPADLKGKKIGTPSLDGANFVGLRALLADAGLQAEDVTVEAIGFNQVPALSAGQVDAVVVYTNNEPIRLAAQGEKLHTIPVSDYVPLAANGILSSETVVAQEPELVRAFVRALARGIQATIEDPAEAYRISKKYVESLTDDALEQQVLAATIDLWETSRIGYSEAAAWDTMQAILLETGLLAAPQDLSKAYTNEFVP